MSAVKQPRYTTTFTTKASVYRPSPIEEKEARASLDQLKSLLPAHINPETDPTTVYVVGNLAVPGTCNLNDDALSIEDGLRIYRRFEHQQTNVEHHRGQVVGFIVRAGLSEFGTNRIITEDEARAANKPFNIVTVAAIWRVVDPDLCDYLVQSSAPGSPDADSLSLSFEVGFDDYDVVVLPKGVTNLSQASKVLTPDSEGFDRWDKMLRAKKGSGLTKGGERVGRLLVGDIIPLGQGIVTVPAAAVKGLKVITSSPHAPEDETDAGSGYTFSSTQLTLRPADAPPFMTYAESIEEDDLFKEEDDELLANVAMAGQYGREKEHHITALYGLAGIDPAPVQAALANHGPIPVSFGKVSAFERPEAAYDVLKVDVESPELHALHATLKKATNTTPKWPVYSPHLTIAYLRKGRAAKYVGDARFVGKSLTFSSLTFSPHTGDRAEIPFVGLNVASATQTDAAGVYKDSQDDPMALSRFIKLSAGWQDKLAALKTADAALASVSLTLSDGRIITAKVLDVSTVEAAEEIGMAGVVVTSMTPGVAPQVDTSPPVCPRANDVYPTTDEKARAEAAEREAARVAATTAPYEGKTSEQIAKQGVDTTKDMKDNAKASLTTEEVMRGLESPFQRTAFAIHHLIEATNAAPTSVSYPNLPMKTLPELKQAIAAVKTIEDLQPAMANVALFAEEIMRASEAHAQARKDAEAAAFTAATSLAEIKAQLATLTQTHTEMVASQQAAAAQARFDQRMAAVAEAFTFDDESRADVTQEVKACGDDAAFATWLTKAKRLYKAYAKTAVAEFPPKDEKKKDDDDEACKAAAAQALASAKGSPVNTDVINTINSNESLLDKYTKAFAGVTIGGKTVAELSAKK